MKLNRGGYESLLKRCVHIQEHYRLLANVSHVIAACESSSTSEDEQLAANHWRGCHPIG